jgi:hypothetical protein
MLGGAKEEPKGPVRLKDARLFASYKASFTRLTVSKDQGTTHRT